MIYIRPGVDCVEICHPEETHWAGVKIYPVSVERAQRLAEDLLRIARGIKAERSGVCRAD